MMMTTTDSSSKFTYSSSSGVECSCPMCDRKTFNMVYTSGKASIYAFVCQPCYDSLPFSEIHDDELPF